MKSGEVNQMQGSMARRRASSTTRNGVAAGSVWESRMRMDAVQGGIKVFNGQEDGNADEEGLRVYEKLRRSHGDGIGEGRRKRRSWGVPEPTGSFLVDKTPIRMRFGGDFDGEVEIGGEEESWDFDDKEIDQPVEKLGVWGDFEKGRDFFWGASSLKFELQENPLVVSSFDEEEVVTMVDSAEVEKKGSFDVEGKMRNPVESMKIGKKMDFDDVSGEKFELQKIHVLQAWNDIEKAQNLDTVSSVDVEKKKKQQNFDVFSAEKIEQPVFVSASEVGKSRNSVLQASKDVEKGQNFDTVSSEKFEKHQSPVVVSSPEVQRKQGNLSESSPHTKKKQHSVFQAWSKLEKKQSSVATSSRKREKKHSPSWTSVDTDNQQDYKFSAPLKKDSPMIETMKKSDLDYRKLSASKSQEQVPTSSYHGHAMQSIVDLVMWKNVQRSAIVFGFGTFLLLFFSYAEDFGINSVSVASYFCLICLASIFIYKSILHRGERKNGKEKDERYMVGEEEAIWMLRVILPYINEMLLSLTAIFSGDPATTMKFAVLLLVMAKCGSSITLWNLAKLTFLGAFTIPKLYSSYSNQLARQGEYFFEMLKDGWESSNHKKTIVIATFIVVWGISSTAARIWSVFVLIVAMKLYQQRSEEDKLDETKASHKSANPIQEQMLHQKHSFMMDKIEAVRERKLKNGF